MSTPTTEPAWRRYQARNRPGRGFERFVAAIRLLEDRGADVRWDEKINGRQFDVTVRSRHGESVDLTVIECRDLGKHVQVSAVEAFATKAAGASASQKVIVSNKGFSTGAIRVAKEQGIQLCTLNEFVEAWPEGRVEEPGEALNIRKVQFVGWTGSPYERSEPEEEYIPRTFLVFPGDRRISFNHFITLLQSTIVPQCRAAARARMFDHRFRPGTWLIFPGAPLVPIARVRFEANIIPALFVKRLPPPVNMPTLRKYSYSEIDGRESRRFEAHELPLGFGTVLTPGKFYRDMLGFTLKCLEVRGDKAHMIHLDLQSREHRGIAAMDLTMPADSVRGWVLIEDEAECARLEDLYRRIEVSSPFPPWNP